MTEFAHARATLAKSGRGPAWRLALAAGLLALACAGGAQAACGPRVTCLSTASVKNAAGVPPDLLYGLGFGHGGSVLASSPETLAQIAAAWKASAKGRVLTLHVSADSGLRGAAATAQATARAAALTQALQAAGIPAASLKVTAH